MIAFLAHEIVLEDELSSEMLTALASSIISVLEAFVQFNKASDFS